MCFSATLARCSMPGHGLLVRYVCVPQRQPQGLSLIRQLVRRNNVVLEPNSTETKLWNDFSTGSHYNQAINRDTEVFLLTLAYRNLLKKQCRRRLTIDVDDDFVNILQVPTMQAVSIRLFRSRPIDKPKMYPRLHRAALTVI